VVGQVEERVRAAHEEAFHFLQTNLKDLVEAMLGDKTD
jgi:hypothetical protein